MCGVLHTHGRAKVDNLLDGMLSRVKPGASLAEQARCVGLIGAILRDLAPLDYDFEEQRYRDLMGRVMAIFERKSSQRVPIETRIEAADALGQSADPRFDWRHPDYWVEVPARGVFGG